jgi:hypothetical protein
MTNPKYTLMDCVLKMREVKAALLAADGHWNFGRAEAKALAEAAERFPELAQGPDGRPCGTFVDECGRVRPIRGALSYENGKPVVLHPLKTESKPKVKRRPVNIESLANANGCATVAEVDEFVEPLEPEVEELPELRVGQERLPVPVAGLDDEEELGLDFEETDETD